MKNKQSKPINIKVILVIILIVAIAIAAILFHVNSIKKVRAECELVNQEMYARISAATRTVYKALADIPQGQILTEDLLTLDSGALCDDAQTQLMSADDIGKKATVNISAGEIIKSSMVTEPLDKDWQEAEYNCIWLSTNLNRYDSVDIRILFPNGTDYIVVSKKELRKVKLSKNNVFLWLTEDEILNLDSAIVDANLHGGRIYTTRYVKPEIEEANKVTYQPTAQIIDLMNSDENVLIEAKQNLSKTARAAMESKIKEFKEDVVQQEEDDSESGYDFTLDTMTSAGNGSAGSDNNGYTPDEEDLAEEAEEAAGSAVESARNEGMAETEGTINE